MNRARSAVGRLGAQGLVSQGSGFDPDLFHKACYMPFTCRWRFEIKLGIFIFILDAVKTLLCSSRSNSIYRCYIEDSIAISYALGKHSHRNHDGLCFSCPCSDVQLLRFWTLNSTLIGIQDWIIMEESTLEGMRTLHVDTRELACNTLKYCKRMYAIISKENKSTYRHRFLR